MGALHEVAVGCEGKGKKEKTILRILEGDTVPIPDSDAAIRLIKYAPPGPQCGRRDPDCLIQTQIANPVRSGS